MQGRVFGRTGRLVGIVLAALLASLSAAEVAPSTPSDDALRAKLLHTYIHGVDDELAQQVLGDGALPLLRELLMEPTFPRRDNVVAFLAHLDTGESIEALLRFLDAPPAGWSTPEEDRALLLAPVALGHIARRAGAAGRPALDALLEMTADGAAAGPLARAAATGSDPVGLRDDLLESALRGLAYSGKVRARDRLVDVALGRAVPAGVGREPTRAAQVGLALFDELDELDGLDGGAAAPPTSRGAGSGAGSGAGESAAAVAPARLDGGAGPGAPVSPEDLDPNVNVVDSAITYANHVDVPNPMDDARLDAVLAESDLRAGRADLAGDVACCVTVTRSGTANSFGTSGDGLDLIDNGSELSAVLGNGVARVKVVRVINYCGGPGTNIVGCAWTPGFGMAVVRMGQSNESILWLHEYGHNTGLSHVADDTNIMFSSITGDNKTLTQSQCDRYHAPFGSASLSVTGVCEDVDLDHVHDGVDNCPAEANTDQANADGDGWGDACDQCPQFFGPDADDDLDGFFNCGDNCPLVPNDQSDADGDGAGDACDPYPTDPDDDGVDDAVDNCAQVSNPAQGDGDGDGRGDLCDNCAGASNAGQEDVDGDGAGDACDCQPQDPDDRLPGGPRVEAGAPAPGTIRLTWDALPGADAYLVTRGSLAALGPQSYGDCVIDDLSGTAFDDATPPPAGAGFSYLVQGESFDCGLGDLGPTSAELPRQNLDGGACQGSDVSDALAASEDDEGGTVSGSYVDTQATDDVIQTITEELSGGSPSSRTSFLEHRWTLEVVAGSRVEFHLEAWWDGSPDGDVFKFDYSTDGGSSWNPIPLSLPWSATDSDLVVELPAALAGSVLVRVIDSNRSPGRVDLDSVHIDQLFVRSIP